MNGKSKQSLNNRCQEVRRCCAVSPFSRCSPVSNPLDKMMISQETKRRTWTSPWIYSCLCAAGCKALSLSILKKKKRREKEGEREGKERGEERERKTRKKGSKSKSIPSSNTLSDQSIKRKKTAPIEN